MFDSGPAPFSLLQRVCSATRAQACAAAERLVAIGELLSLRMREAGETEDWAVDPTEAVTAEIAAALSISHRLAGSHLHYARALRELVPMVGRLFIAGDIDEATFRMVVFRTGLIVDDDVLAAVDRKLALGLPRWGSSNRAQLADRIDQAVASVDLDAVRRRKDRISDRDVVVGDVDNGLVEIHATVAAPDGHAFDERLTAMAATVCDEDPRTLGERRSDAVGPLSAGADRLGCRCGRSECPAVGKTASSVVIHVVAERATVEGTGHTPAAMIGHEGLIPAELIAELARAARLRPLVHPTDCAPEAGYVPSRGLADFVRCRDLTCRFPGCGKPATAADIDHTIPYRQGGPTQAANLECLCRLHHLVETFWGWHDRQLADATVIWTSPTGEVYVTHPGSAFLFPGLCERTELVRVLEVPVPTEPRGDRASMMPRRTLTREQQRTADITAKRQHNHEMRTVRGHDRYQRTASGPEQNPMPPPF